MEDAIEPKASLFGSSDNEPNATYLIDFIADKMLSLDTWNGIISKSESLMKTWGFIVSASSEAGAKIRGRMILPHSFIVENYGELDENALKKLADYGLLKYQLVKLPTKPRVKLVGKPTNATSARIQSKTDGFVNYNSSAKFAEFWSAYPSRGGTKLKKSQAEKWFMLNVNSVEMETSIMDALERYKTSSQVVNGFAKDAINWLPDWEAWREFDASNEPKPFNTRQRQATINRAEEGKLIL